MRAKCSPKMTEEMTEHFPPRLEGIAPSMRESQCSFSAVKLNLEEMTEHFPPTAGGHRFVDARTISSTSAIDL